MTILKKGILKQINETDILIDGSVNYFDDLPSASSHTGKIYIVQLDQGVVFINKKRAGLYISNGVSWSRLGDLTNMLKTSDVVNNLTSTDSDKPLSANQGKILNDNKQGTLTAGANITITNDVISSTLPVAGASIGGVKSGTDITVDVSGNVSVNDDSHNHIISNVDGLQTALDGKEPTITSASTSDYYRGDKTFQPLNKTAVGLANVDNTSDLNKPISSATQTALDGKEPSFTKNTAFNKNFGTNSGEVAEGSDSRIVNALQNDGSSDSYISGVAQANVDSLSSALVTFGGVSGGNPALTVQVVMKTTDGKVQIASLDDGNEILFFLNSDDLKNGTVKTRVFLSKGEIYIESGLNNGSIITSSKGIMGASGNNSSIEESPMPLGVQGFQDTQFFMFAFRNSSGGTGNERGEVYIVCGAVPCTVELKNGSGTIVVDSANLGAFEHTVLLTNANSEYQIVATNPVFVGTSAAMNITNPSFYDMRLVPPLATEIIGQNRRARVSALYDNTEVWWYRQNGEIGKVTVSPGSPSLIYTGTQNELGNVWQIQANSTPATAGTFTITLNGETTSAINFDAGQVEIANALDGLTSYSSDDFKVEFVLGNNLGESDATVIIYNMGILARTNVTIILNTGGLTGNTHTYSSIQSGTSADNAGGNADYAKEGIIILRANAPISAFSGADGAGLEATYFVPTNSLTQRIGTPLAIKNALSGSSNCIAIQSPFKCEAKIFGSNGEFLYSLSSVRSYSNPVNKFQQRFPTGVVLGFGAGLGIDVALDSNFLGGYIETDVPCNIVINTSENEILISNGIKTNGDEMICFGVTPDNIKAEIKQVSDGRTRKRVVDSSGSETWELT